MLKNRKSNSGPTVIIGCVLNTDTNHFLSEIIFGLEEEEIPFIVEKQDDNDLICDTVESAYNMALRSSLAVGIFIGRDKEIVLHHKKLPPKQPYFYLEPNEVNLDKARRIGTNAGRIVKRLPLLDI